MINPTDIDWEELVKKVDAVEPTEGWGWDGEPAKVVFLGTASNLTPLGVHLFFGWWMEMLELAKRHGLFLTSNGDPCDIMVGKFVEV